METEKLVTIRDVDSKLFAKGKIVVKEYSKPERTRRALKFAGMSLGLAFATLFVPIVHFVSVPFFFLASPFVFSFFVNREKAMLGGEGECPHCHGQFRIESGSMKFPMEDLCNLCKKAVWIELNE